MKKDIQIMISRCDSKERRKREGHLITNSFDLGICPVGGGGTLYICLLDFIIRKNDIFST